MMRFTFVQFSQVHIAALLDAVYLVYRFRVMRDGKNAELSYRFALLIYRKSAEYLNSKFRTPHSTFDPPSPILSYRLVAF